MEKTSRNAFERKSPMIDGESIMDNYGRFSY